MPAVIQLALGVSQLGLSLWASTYSYAAITRLQEYEDTSKKAAKFSGTAEHELHKTRTTQTSGALVIAATIIWSCVVLFNRVESTSSVAFIVSSALTAGILAARTHVSNFWTPKSGVPLVQKYNEGIENTKQLAHVLSYMSAASGLQVVYFAYSFVSTLL